MARWPTTRTRSIRPGTLDTTALSGSIDYDTPVTFEGDNFGNPHTGELLVTGDNSSARLIAIDSTDVRIEIDSDGDGDIDETLFLTWEELAGS